MAAGRGLDAREIGIVLAVPMLVRILAVPLATRLIDRHAEVQIALAVAATLGAAAYAVMGFADGFVGDPRRLCRDLARCPRRCCRSPIRYGLRGLKARGSPTGRCGCGDRSRSSSPTWPVEWCSSRWGAGASRLGADRDYRRDGGGDVAAAALADGGEPPRAQPSASGGLWRSGVFVAVIVGASLIQASHAVLYGFVTLQWTAKGLDGTTIGAVVGARRRRRDRAVRGIGTGGRPRVGAAK